VHGGAAIRAWSDGERAADEYGAFSHPPDPGTDIFGSDAATVVGHPQADRSKPSGEEDLHTSAVRMAGSRW
jgi:hypothetical protein